jgi:hypothetical protein
VVTVLGNNTVTLTSGAGTDNQTKQQGIAITSITYSTTVATGANFSGLPTGITGNWTANVVTISGSSNTVGTYNYVVTLTGGCGGVVTANGTIIIALNLPVTLISFNGRLNSDKTITLQWKVGEQLGIQKYIVEESLDGSVFRELGSVTAVYGTAASYSYNDIQVPPGKNYYRLKIVEFSGKISYSDIAVVNLKENTNIIVYPNPVTSQFTIQQLVTLKNKLAYLCNMEGKILQNISLRNINQQVNMEGYASGIYILKMEDGTVFKVFKQ